ncbi:MULTISPECIES: hypothetical protein [unclassified Bradyrhizobium]|nr:MULTISPECIES: hypothetical protein [unclassified Bradyrhizobium]
MVAAGIELFLTGWLLIAPPISKVQARMIRKRGELIVVSNL